MDQKYFAFISYSHRDSKWGDWLHRALETFKVPEALRNTQGRYGEMVPEKIFPVFRDREELPTSAELGVMIARALEQSKTLIVICSTNSAGSRWVNEEILAFKKTGKGDRILALIVDGEPNASDKGQPERECFPEALRFNVGSDGRIDRNQPSEPIAADARTQGDGKANALLKIVAGVLGVEYDAIRRREELRRRRRQRVTITAISSLVLVFAVLSVFALTQWRSAVAQRQEASLQRDRAVAQTELAEEQRFLAENQTVLAEDRRVEAEQERQTADRQRDIAENERGRAESASTRALSERDAALVSQSRFLAQVSERVLQEGDPGTALALALEALPDPDRGIDRPWTDTGEAALLASLLRLKEQPVGSLQNPEIVALAPDGTSMILREGRDNYYLAAFEQDSITLSPLPETDSYIVGVEYSRDSSMVLLFGNIGSRIVYDCRDNRVVSQPPGLVESLVHLFSDPSSDRIILTFEQEDQSTLHQIVSLKTGEVIDEFVISQDYIDPLLPGLIFRRTLQLTALSPDGRYCLFIAHTEARDSTLGLEGGQSLLIYDRDKHLEISPVWLGGEAWKFRGFFNSADTKRVFLAQDSAFMSYKGSEDTIDSVEVDYETGTILHRQFVEDRQSAAIDTSPPYPAGEKFHWYLENLSADGSRTILRSMAPPEGELKASLRTISTPGGDSMVALEPSVEVWLSGVRFSPDESRIIAAVKASDPNHDDIAGYICDTSSGDTVTVLEQSDPPAVPKILSADNSLVAGLGPEGEIAIWNARDGRCIGNLGIHEDATELKFADGDRRLLSYENSTYSWQSKSLRLWDLQSSRMSSPPPEADSLLFALADEGGSTLLGWNSINGENLIVHRSPPTWSPITIPAPAYQAFRPFRADSSDGWNISGNGLFDGSVAVSMDSGWVVAFNNKAPGDETFIDTHTGEIINGLNLGLSASLVYESAGNNSGTHVEGLWINPHNHDLWASRNGFLVQIDRPTKTLQARYAIEGFNAAATVEFSHDGQFAAVVTSDPVPKLVLISIESGQIIGDYDISAGVKLSLIFSSHNRVFAAVSDREVMAFDLTSQSIQPVRWLLPEGFHHKWSRDGRLSPDGTLLYSAGQYELRSFITFTGESEQVFIAGTTEDGLPTGRSGAPVQNSIASWNLSPDGSRLAMISKMDVSHRPPTPGQDGSGRVWDTGDGTLISILESAAEYGERHFSIWLSFESEGKVIASATPWDAMLGSDESINRYWDAERGSYLFEQEELNGNRNYSHNLAWLSEDAGWYFQVEEGEAGDDIITLRGPGIEHPLTSFEIPGAAAEGVRISGDGKSVLMFYHGGIIVSYPLPSGTLNRSNIISLARQAVPRKLDEAAREEYFLSSE